MWKRSSTIAGTAIAWGVAVADLFSALPTSIDDSLSRFALAVAMVGSARIMLWCHDRPMATAYEIGFAAGQREQIRAANCSKKVTRLDEYRPPLARVGGDD